MKKETITEPSIALYRKYRPQTFDEILGQDHIVKVLENSIKTGNIAHAYLFAGSRGTGKTSIARIFAGAIGCTPRDLYEIDAASNRGIDDIRELREGVRTLPFESPYKVYIVDEVHMLTKEAFNALLKTLEEPPKHVIFILATTELNKLPETVISRCQTYTFKKPSQKILKELLIAMAKKEGFALDLASAELVAVLGDGSFRDAVGILQKVLSSSESKTVSIDGVLEVTGAPKGELVNSFISAIAEKDVSQGMEAVRRAGKENIDMQVFLRLILHKVRLILLLRFAKEMEREIESELTEEDFSFLKMMSGKDGAHITSKALMALLNAHSMMRHAAIPELPLELAMMELGVNNEVDMKR